jgi:hypothetical protein
MHISRHRQRQSPLQDVLGRMECTSQTRRAYETQFQYTEQNGKWVAVERICRPAGAAIKEEPIPSGHAGRKGPDKGMLNAGRQDYVGCHGDSGFRA